MKRSLLLFLLFGFFLLSIGSCLAMAHNNDELMEPKYQLNADEGRDRSEVRAEGEEGPGPFRRLYNRWITTWNEGDFTLIMPLYAWHISFMYDKEHRHKYNEWPWGGGLGLSMFDEDKDTHILFAMAFQDSWNEIQPCLGYGYLKNWYLDEANDYRVGVGYAMGITARDNYEYIPFPAALPIFGVGYKSLSLEATYIPGTFNNGNVLFGWVRWTFD